MCAPSAGKRDEGWSHSRGMGEREQFRDGELLGGERGKKEVAGMVSEAEMARRRRLAGRREKEGREEERGKRRAKRTIGSD